MLDTSDAKPFATINRAYNATFKPGRMTVGIVAPIEAHGSNPVPTMDRHIERAQLADTLGFAAVWLRDVPFNVPSFGDAGQIYDPFVYLGALSMATHNIALGVASVVLPLRHPAHVAKAAASVDVMSGGRLLLGVASGDRPEEYPAMGMTFPDRGARFRDSVAYMRSLVDPYPGIENSHGTLSGGLDMLPKPTGPRLPLLITGGSQQDPAWVARNGDGWMTYPRDAQSQGRVVADYRSRIAKHGGPDKPVMQSLYVDVLEDADAAPRPIHLGFQSGTTFLRDYLREIQTLGINHVALNLRFNSADIETTLNRLANDLLPDFAE
ncbi:luciferase-type oxidoreductase, BA3436 family [Poseidonocella pacifica]|uniref:Luciferase-type oxidoreductase, BA3436 family n=1 Tax=Poseidonocella pacifica TaxID=871651 RepID=A0A1I0W7J9_9RHOB|nr:LLM class oxidoreductase [Poseidonocella pacifica]SFA84729.1 luciferase-type oxidoreductase, BA3436 family [Poseidonocella pacifica]